MTTHPDPPIAFRMIDSHSSSSVVERGRLSAFQEKST
jgi:hypothetical protein